MPEKRARGSRLAPWLALALLGCLHLAASAWTAPVSSERRWDVADTHQRLQRIYDELGIKRDESPPAQGCNCARRENAPDSSRPARRRISAAPLPPLLGYLLLAVVIVVMLVPLIIALRRGYREQTPLAAPPDEDDDARGTEQPRGPWVVNVRQARALFEEGRIAESFAALHRATLLALERAQHLTVSPNMTNWEYVRRLSAEPPLRDLLASVTLAAEEAVLGRRAPAPERYLALERLIAERVQR